MTEHIEQQLDVATLNAETIRRATLTVCDHAANPLEARELLQMLGLVETPQGPPKPHRAGERTNTNRCRECGCPTTSRPTKSDVAHGVKRAGGKGYCGAHYKAFIRGKL